MKTKILFITLLSISKLSVGQVNQNLEKFFAMLTTENLNNEETKIIEINGTVLTCVDYLNEINHQTDCQVDLSNLPSEVRWTTKEEYDYIYPEDLATNSDAEHITLFFSKNVVERKSYSNLTGNHLKSKSEAQITMERYVNITFKNSDLASKAQKHLMAYIEDMSR